MQPAATDRAAVVIVAPMRALLGLLIGFCLATAGCGGDSSDNGATTGPGTAESRGGDKRSDVIAVAERYLDGITQEDASVVCPLSSEYQATTLYAEEPCSENPLGSSGFFWTDLDTAERKRCHVLLDKSRPAAYVQWQIPAPSGLDVVHVTLVDEGKGWRIAGALNGGSCGDVITNQASDALGSS